MGGLVHPTALAACPRPHLLDRLPEAEGAVGDRELGSHRKPPPFEVEEANYSKFPGHDALLEPILRMKV